MVFNLRTLSLVKCRVARAETRDLGLSRKVEQLNIQHVLHKLTAKYTITYRNGRNI